MLFVIIKNAFQKKVMEDSNYQCHRYIVLSQQHRTKDFKNIIVYSFAFSVRGEGQE